MATIGSSTSTPTHGYNGTAVYNEVASDLVTMPVTGDITTIHCYFAGNGGSFNAKLCIWDLSGALIASTPSFSVGSGTSGAGNQGWQSHALSSSLRVNAGDQIRIGWWEDDSRGQYFSVFSSGNWHGQPNVPTTPGSMSGAATPGSPYLQGGVGAYADYTTVTTGGSRIRRSGAWTTITPKIKRSGTQTSVTPKIRRSGAWTTVS